MRPIADVLRFSCWFFQDSLKVFALSLVALCVAVWGPALPGPPAMQVWASMTLLAAQSSAANIALWQCMFIIMLVCGTVAKVPLRLNEPADKPPRFTWKVGVGMPPVLALVWLLVLTTPAPGGRHEAGMSFAVTAALWPGFVHALTADWGGYVLSRLLLALRIVRR